MKHRGFGLTELLVVLAAIALALLVSLPALARLGSGARAAAAARNLALTFHALRWKSVSLNAGHGLLFEQDAAGWRWLEVRDGNGNGLRTAEVRSGTDRTLSGPHRLGDKHPRIALGFPPGGPIPRIPPRPGSLSPSDDPVRFGHTKLVSFTPLGTSSSGTVYLTDGRDELFGVLLFGPTARVRVWRYTRTGGAWKL